VICQARRGPARPGSCVHQLGAISLAGPGELEAQCGTCDCKPGNAPTMNDLPGGVSLEHKLCIGLRHVHGGVMAKRQVPACASVGLGSDTVVEEP